MPSRLGPAEVQASTGPNMADVQRGRQEGSVLSRARGQGREVHSDLGSLVITNNQIHIMKTILMLVTISVAKISILKITKVFSSHYGQFHDCQCSSEYCVLSF